MLDIFLPVVNGAKWMIEQLSDLTGNTGVALIVFTILIRLATLPLTLKAMRSTLIMQELQPMVKDIQKQYKGDQQMIMQQSQALYAQYGASQFGGCLPMLLQLPIFIILSSAINAMAFDPNFKATGFLWVPDLSHPDPLHILPILSGLAQVISVRMAMRSVKDADTQVKLMNTLSTTLFPAMAILFAWTWPAGPVIYWVTSSILAGVQSYFINGWGSLREILPFLPAAKSRSHLLVKLTEEQIAERAEKKKGSLMGKLVERSMEANLEAEKLKAERAAGGTTTSVVRPNATLRTAPALAAPTAAKTAKVSGGYYSTASIVSEEPKREPPTSSNDNGSGRRGNGNNNGNGSRANGNGSRTNGNGSNHANGSNANTTAASPAQARGSQQLSYEEMLARRNRQQQKKK